MFFALIPYLYVLQNRHGMAEINRATYFTMFIFNLITIYWVGSWTKEADPFLMISGFVLMFFNPILFLIPSTLFYFAKKYIGEKLALFLMPFFWVTYEYLYSITDLRFPWLTLGNSLTSFKLFIQIADVIGVYGLSIIIVSVNVLLIVIIEHYRKTKQIQRIESALLVLIIMLTILYGSISLDKNFSYDSKIKVGIIQPNLNPWNKWQEGNVDELLNLYLDLSSKAIKDGAELLVWPETALPVYLTIGSYEEQLWRLKNFLRQHKIFLLTGMPDGTIYDKKSAPKDAKPLSDSTKLYTSYNSIFFINPYNDEIKKYGKEKLVPFGEKVPFVEYIPLLGDIIKWNVGISSWNTGNDTTVFELQTSNQPSPKIGGVICIESIYSDYVAQFVNKGAQLIAVVTNDSWYGNSSGPYQHKDYAILRAVENRRFVVRSANGGISCIIDPYGNILNETKLFTRNYLVGTVGLISSKTFFSTHPLLLPFLAVLVSILTILVILYKKIAKSKT
ncbi:MAG: apolipoprotein N-acyltransferase [Ignavibacteriales bacterium]